MIQDVVLDRLMHGSGFEHVYCKIHVNDPLAEKYEVLWLSDDTSHDDALKMDLEEALDHEYEKVNEPMNRHGSGPDVTQTSPSQKEVLKKIHLRLGHPSNTTLHRMLKLGGAPKELLQQASSFRCPTCEQVQEPGKPPTQRPSSRPAAFNVEVHVDLKYAQNIKGQTVVTLSMVDAGTNYHRAVLVKTRQPGYVAKKFLKHWIAIFGRPTRMVLDQGGEFEKEWILMLEGFGIHSITTAAHAGWQHALAERHGGILGMIWRALNVQFNAQSSAEMAATLAAATEAKNELVTRKGYSANMLVFGKNVSYPELLADEDYEPLTQAQGLDTDAEMLKSCKVRHAARQILLRDDIQQKLKRALMRRPQTRHFILGRSSFSSFPRWVRLAIERILDDGGGLL